MTELPSVSAIIPTIGRATLRDSVLSVLSQIDCRPEAVVVLDAPENIEQVKKILEGLPHLLIITNHSGAAHARNIGLDAARGDYIGYLDDDDIWMPEKSREQIMAIERSQNPALAFSVVASQFVRDDGYVDSSIPRTYCPDKDTIGNFITARKSIRFRTVYFNTPGLLGRSELMKQCRWDDSLRKHQDWDLIIRLASIENVTAEVVAISLVRVYQGSIGSISMRRDWEDGQAFLNRHDTKITGRARSDFVLLQMALHAIHNRSMEGVLISLRSMSFALPHLGALIRFFAGLILHR